jgi:hypothetical protein
MSDIFISYGHEDRAKAQMLAQTLEGRGWSTFWDRTIPIGKTWRETIERELNDARCAIVLWSKTSIDSGWVQEEADDAKQRGILVPILVENVRVPIGFRSIQAADLTDWEPTEPTQAFDRLIADIAALVGPVRSAQPDPKILINYRRDDSKGMAGRLYDRLGQTFGHDKLFMDAPDIFEEDFLVPSDQQLRASNVVLVLIGSNWLNMTDAAGKVRIQQPDDFVAIEISVALARDIRIIPVLLDGARMPKASELPYTLTPLARRQAVEVRHAHFGQDAEALIERIRGAAPA